MAISTGHWSQQRRLRHRVTDRWHGERWPGAFECGPMPISDAALCIGAVQFITTVLAQVPTHRSPVGNLLGKQWGQL